MMLKSALGLALVLCFTTVAKASLLMYEPFNYPVGSTLVGQTNPSNGQTWAITGALGTAGGTGPTIAAGNLSNPNMPPSVGNQVNLKNIAGDTATPRIQISAAGIGTASGQVWYSLLVQAPATNVGNGTAGSFIAGFNNTAGSQSGALTAIAAALTIHANGTGYSFGIVTGNAATRVFDDTHVFGAGDTALIVASYTYGPGASDDVANLYINPDPTAANPPSPSAVMTNDLGSAIKTFFVRDNTSEPTGGMFMDEIRVGDTWADVANVVPEPTAGLLLIAAGVPSILARRSRRARDGTAGRRS